MAYLEHARAVQPPANILKCCYGVIGPKCQCDRMKIEPVNLRTKRINDKKVQRDETTYLERASAAQPPQNDPKCSYRVIGLDRW